MKRILVQIMLGLIFCSVVHSATYPQSTQTWTTLEADNWFTGGWFTSDGATYCYGTTDNFTVKRRNTSGTITTRGSIRVLDATFNIYTILATTTPDLVFVVAYNASSQYFLLRSTDGASTFTNVMTFGAGGGAGGTQIAGVQILSPRSFLELTKPIGNLAAGTLLVGEYSTVGGRVPGSTNDQVRLMMSTDHGVTWSAAMTWNTDGANNNITHVHAVKQDPYTGYIYVCTGDSNPGSSIIRWDGVGAWVNNTNPANQGAISGFKVNYGDQGRRTVDIIFSSGHAYTFSDAAISSDPTTAAMGIWQWEKDLSEGHRVNTDIIAYDDMHVGWFGEEYNGVLVFMTSPQYSSPGVTWDTPNAQIYISDDGGTSWQARAQYDFRSNASEPKIPSAMFQLGGKLFITGRSAGKSTGCSELRLDTSAPYGETRVIAPVYYVGTWSAAGSDANDGLTATTPWANLHYALSGSRICGGARIRMAPGNYTNDYVNTIWNAPVTQGMGTVYIEGAGKDSTIINIPSGQTNNYGVYYQLSRVLYPVEYRDLSYINDRASAVMVALAEAGTEVRFKRCLVGKNTVDPGVIFEIKDSTLDINRSVISGGTTTSFINDTSVTASTISVKYSLLIGGFTQFKPKKATALTMYNNTVYGYSSTAVTIDSSATVIPTIKNNIFNSSATAISDASGQTEADANIDYNLYFGGTATSNVANSGGSHRLTVDPKMVDPANGVFRLRSGSPAVNAGVSVGLTTDFAGRTIRGLPDIGAYEFLPGNGNGFNFYFNFSL